LNNRQTVLTALLLLCAVLSGWHVLQERTVTQRPDVSRLGSDVFVENMDLQLINEHGRLQYRVMAERMEHFPYDDHAELVRPVLHVFKNDQPTWQIESEQGKVASGYKTVRLLGQVEIRRLAGPEIRPLSIVTSDLLVTPQQRTATTENSIVIQSGRYRIESVGLQADLINNRLELKSRVRGRIDAAG
jgi:lipopolysaccharide export system protein LptC